MSEDNSIQDVDIKEKVSVIILGGGVGTRTRSDIPKQFTLINGKPLIVFTIEAFQKCEFVERICIVSHKDYINELKTYVQKYNLSKVIHICEGGRTNLESTFKGISFYANSGLCEENTIIQIHDGVRPLISEDAIKDNVRQAIANGAAFSGIESVESFVHSADGMVSDNYIRRDGYYRVSSPYAVRLKILLSISKQEDIFAKDVSLFDLYYGKIGKIFLSKDYQSNIKVTYPEDLAMITSVLSNKC